jgi:hypothetical protein
MLKAAASIHAPCPKQWALNPGGGGQTPHLRLLFNKLKLFSFNSLLINNLLISFNKRKS